MKGRVVSIAAAAVVLGLNSSARSAEPVDDASVAIGEILDVAAGALVAADNAEERAETGSVDDLEPKDLWKPLTYYDPLIDDFLADVGPIATGKGGPRKSVAAKYGLSGAALDETIGFLRQMAKDGYNDKQDASLRSRALRLVETGERAPIALMLSAGAINHVGDNCTAADVGLLMKGSRNLDRDLWAIATSCASSEAFEVALDQSVAARPALFYLLMNWTRSDPASELAALDMLLRPSALNQIAQGSRDAVHADIARYKLGKLFDLGLLDDAIKFGESLTPQIQELALKRPGEKIRTNIGGFNLQTPLYQGAAETVDYAAALALAGRPAEARAVLNLIAPAAKRQEVRDCLDAGKDKCSVGDQATEIPLGALLVDHFLNQPDADPYLFVESQAVLAPSITGGAALLFCGLKLRPDEQQECQRARYTIASALAEKEYDDSDRALWATMRRVGGAEFETARAGYAAKLPAMGPVEEPKRDWSRTSVDPAPIPFRELPLPADALAKKPSDGVGPKGFGELPDGFTLVRIERAGQRAAAVTLSQRFDPNGEVSGGGYWLHLSNDGGKSWEEPLYTGLAEHFPYIVPARARLPMLAGDRIHLEVEEALIDTATISYPPVGTRLKRKRKDIYLDVSIADLRKDSDNDGLSDIAARHLLLDQPTTKGTPFVVGQEKDCSAPSAETLARLEILKKIFQVETQGLIEPVGPKKELTGPWRKSLPTKKPPIFLKANPNDYRCVVLDRPMIVYSETDHERLRRHSPDFQLIEMPPIRWNRDHTRGFVNWSMGWAGGTYRLIREGSGWKLESISEWVS